MFSHESLPYPTIAFNDLSFARTGTGGGGGTLGVRYERVHGQLINVAAEASEQLINTKYGKIFVIGSARNGEIIFQLGDQTYSAFPKELAEEIPELTNL